MIRISTIALLVTSLGVAACQPAKTPEQVAAENAAKAMQDMAAAFGGMAGGANGAQVSPDQLAAAMAQAGAIAGAMNAEMTPEERAQMQAITGAIASGQVHPAASAYVSGLDKVFTTLSGVKDDASFNAVKPQLAAIYAEMSGPSAALNAMTENDREVAFGSAYPQLLGFGMKMASIMMPLASNPDLAEKVGDLLEEMPTPG